MGSLDGETVLVTGASRGLGREMALRFAAEGADVALLARDEDDLAAVAGEVAGGRQGARSAAGRADDDAESLVLPADVTDRDAVEAAVSAAEERFDGVDTLVNNAGIGQLSIHDEGRPLVEVTDEDWHRILAVNLTGVFHCTRAVLPGMVERGRGNVVNVTSSLGTTAAAGWAPYVASKHGLEGLTKTVALEYDDAGVNVNALDPGGRVATAFWDHLADDERDDVAPADVMNDAAVLLAAQGPDGVTGESRDAAGWEATLG